MSFKDVEIEDEYRSLQDDIVQQFYQPLLKEAIKYQLMDIAIKQEGTKNDHWNMATSFDNLADLMILTNNYQEARNYQEQAIEIRENVQGKSHPDLIKSYQNMIVILENLGDLEKIAQYYSKLSQIQK